jgi:hypothetical protein
VSELSFGLTHEWPKDSLNFPGNLEGGGKMQRPNLSESRRKPVLGGVGSDDQFRHFHFGMGEGGQEGIDNPGIKLGSLAFHND